MTKVFFLCPGLGHIWRGYESFAQESFSILSQKSSLDIVLFKGKGLSQDKEITLATIKRHKFFAKNLEKLLRIISKSVKNFDEYPKQCLQRDYDYKQDGYFIEQLSFLISLLPQLHRQKPDVIYFSDDGLGYLLWYWRHLTKQKYKLLFRNGGSFSPPFPYWDCVQQLTPTHFQQALRSGEPATKHHLLPSGFHISAELQLLSSSQLAPLRSKLGLPEKQPLVLSVAVINKSHKRMDYIIHEVASLPEPRPFLLLLGQQTSESPEIIRLGNELLGKDSFQVRTVPQNEVADYYKIADMFVLASLHEGLPRVLVEAMSHGLPCLAHDYEIPFFVLEREGYLANLEVPGSLAGLILQVLSTGHDEFRRQRCHRSVYDRFSWDRLFPAYVDMIERCAAGT